MPKLLLEVELKGTFRDTDTEQEFVYMLRNDVRDIAQQLADELADYVEVVDVTTDGLQP